MSLSTIDYINFSSLAYVDFIQTDKAHSIGSILDQNLPRQGLDLSRVELSALADPSSPLRSWTLLNFLPNTTSGFSAAAFQNPATGEIVFAFRKPSF